MDYYYLITKGWCGRMNIGGNRLTYRGHTTGVVLTKNVFGAMKDKGKWQGKINIAYVFTKSFTNELSVACTWSSRLLCRYGEEAVKKHTKSYGQYLE